MDPLRRFYDALRKVYRRTFQQQEDKRIREIVQALRAVPVFNDLSRGTLHDLAEALHSRSYKREEYLYREGDPSLGLYIVERGRVCLLVEDEEANLHELRQVTDFGIFGEVSILGDFRRTETAQAVTETRVLGFFSPELKAMTKRDPRTATAVLTALARYVAAQHVELLGQVAEKEGKIAAMRLLDRAVQSAELQESNLPILVRP